MRRLILSCRFAALGAVGLFPPMGPPGGRDGESSRGSLLSGNLHELRRRSGDTVVISSGEVDLRRVLLEILAVVGVTGVCATAARPGGSRPSTAEQ